MKQYEPGCFKHLLSSQQLLHRVSRPTVTSLPRLASASTFFMPSLLPTSQILASTGWLVIGQSPACSSYQIVLNKTQRKSQIGKFGDCETTSWTKFSFTRCYINFRTQGSTAFRKCEHTLRDTSCRTGSWTGEVTHSNVWWNSCLSLIHIYDRKTKIQKK